ncbi:MAG TPA: hypothetical protein VH054_01600, partial [Polyangiaceae bacterium]|nr:hypothetical protein [Polyangiaceae bacterium]
MSFVKAQICIAAVMIVAACGARTGLEAPDVPDAADAVATADASDGAPVSCTPGAISLTAAQPEVMFVLDRSGSMSQKFSGNSSRWASLTAALAATLPPVDATMAIGALIFPRGSANDDCVVPGAPNLAPAVGNVNALVELMSTEKPGGATPTADAISTAASLLSQLRAASTAR